MTRHKLFYVIAAGLALLAIGPVGVTTTAAQTIPPVTPPGANPDGRAYEMVTPPDKNNRRANGLTAVVNTGVPTANGEAMIFAVQNGVLDPEGGTTYPHADDFVRIVRGDAGWKTFAFATLPSLVPAGDSPVAYMGAISGDLRVQAWEHHRQLFASGSHMATQVIGDTAGERGSGWYDWIVDPVIATRVERMFDYPLIDDEGDRMLRWLERYRGLLGPGDPSLGQLPPQPLGCGFFCASYPGGGVVYMQEPPGSGPRHLVNECTSSSHGPTELPARVGTGVGTDTLAVVDCAAGQPTNAHGAQAGSGTLAERAMSQDGKRVFFTSPDPLTAPGAGACEATIRAGEPQAGQPAVGARTDCPPQLFVRQYDSSGPGATGEATVRWISRPQVSDGPQRASMLGTALFEGASADGQVAYFRSNTPLVDGDPNAGDSIVDGAASESSWDLYRYELPDGVDGDPAAGTLTRVTGGPNADADPNTNSANGGGVARYVSDDGHRVYFVTNAPIAGADATPPAGGSTTPGGTVDDDASRNLYLYDATKSGSDAYRFVARIPYDVGRVVDACASSAIPSGLPQTETGISGSIDRRDTSCVRGTPDGQTIAFETTGALSGGDGDSASDVYVYDAEQDQIERASTPPVGSTPYPCDDSAPVEQSTCNADFGFAGSFQAADRVGLAGQRHANLAVRDGEVSVYFESRLPLVAGDVNGDRMDTYEWRDGDLSLISPGAADADAWYSGNSRDGEDVFFASWERIDPREIDEDLDLYDARAGGGFPFALPPARCDVAAGDCEGDGTTPGSPGSVDDGQGERNAVPGLRLRLALGGLSRAERLRAARSGVLRLRVRASTLGAVTAIARARVGGRGRVIGRTSVRLRKPGVTKLRLPLSARARRKLRAGRALRVSVRVRLTGARPRTATFTLKDGRR